MDLGKAFNFFWKSPLRNHSIFRIFLYILLYFVLMVGMYVPFILLSSSSSQDNFNSSDTTTTIFLGISILLLIIYTLLATFVSFTIMGIKIQNTLYLIRSKLKETSFDELPTFKLKETIRIGFKYYVLMTFYALPFIILYLITFVPLVFMSANQDKNPEPLTVVLFILGSCLLFILILLYALFVLMPGKICLVDIIEKHGFRKAFDISYFLHELRSHLKDYFVQGIMTIVPYLILYVIYLFNMLLVLILIGFLFIPLIFVMFIITILYVEPHLIAQAVLKNRENPLNL